MVYLLTLNFRFTTNNGGRWSAFWTNFQFYL